MLVLFSGGRGSGKSTIARALYLSLDAICLRYTHQSAWRSEIRNRYVKLGWILYFLTFFRFKVCRVFYARLYRDIRNNRAKGHLGRIYMPCIFSYHIQRISKQKEQCVVYDSDFLTWATDKVFDGSFNPNEVRDFYRHVVLPYVGDIIVVVCDTPIDEAVERWRIRDNKSFSSEEVYKWIRSRTAWKQARKEVIDIISTIRGIKVINLNGLEDPINNAHRIKVLMQETLRSRESG